MRMKQTLAMLAVILGMGIAASSAYAHHSHPIFYDACKRTTIEGRDGRSNTAPRRDTSNVSGLHRRGGESEHPRSDLDTAGGRWFQLRAAPGGEPGKV